ncbi:MAG: tetratricopeptide repeat protein [Nitrospinae bacterium]|nr:tetratricopeptide repeat protein [Nitrospinota bacterium]
MARHILFHLRKGHLSLLHFAHKTYYQPTLTTYTVADLLRQVRQFDPSAPTERIVPLFITDASSRKQQEVLRMLGAYGICYALFLSPSDPPDVQDEQVASGLVDFVELMETDFALDTPTPERFDDKQIAPTRQYEELLALGSDLMKRGKAEEAIEAFTQALALKPDFDLLIQRGDAFYQTRKYVAALADYRKAQRLKSATPEPDAKIGACCLILAKEMKRQDPDRAEEWFERGVQRLESSRETARELERRYADTPELLGGSPFNPILSALRTADINRGDFEDRQGRLTAVIETAVVRTGAMGEGTLDTILDRGAGLTALGRFDEAQELLDPAFDAHPAEAATTYNNFAVALRKSGDHRRAFETFARMAGAALPERERILKNMRTATMHYACDLVRQGKPEEAEALYTRALALKMDDPEWALCDLALAHLAAGASHAARVYLSKAVSRNPGIVQARRFSEYKGLAPFLTSADKTGG